MKIMSLRRERGKWGEARWTGVVRHGFLNRKRAEVRGAGTVWYTKAGRCPPLWEARLSNRAGALTRWAWTGGRGAQ